MPHIDVSFYPGRTPEVKRELAQKIAGFFTTEMKFPPETISVSFTEIEKEKFAAEVVKKFDLKDLIISSDIVK